jgi:hypothetical protein
VCLIGELGKKTDGGIVQHLLFSMWLLALAQQKSAAPN